MRLGSTPRRSLFDLFRVLPVYLSFTSPPGWLHGFVVRGVKLEDSVATILVISLIDVDGEADTKHAFFFLFVVDFTTGQFHFLRSYSVQAGMVGGCYRSRDTVRAGARPET